MHFLLLLIPHSGLRGCCSLSHLSWGEGGVHLDKSPVHHPTQRDNHLIHLMCIYLDCGTEPEYLERPPAGTGRTCKIPRSELNSQPSCCEATLPTTAPLCRPKCVCFDLRAGVWAVGTHLKGHLSPDSARHRGNSAQVLIIHCTKTFGPILSVASSRSPLCLCK